MTLVALCSLKGAPGVTTAALGLASGWPKRQLPVLVECDPAGGDLLARFRLNMAPGLVTLAAAARRETQRGLLWQHTQRLPGGLNVVAAPAGAEQVCAALGQITGAGVPVLRGVSERPGTVVVADCGRVGPDSMALDIMRDADLTLVLVQARDDALSHLAVSLDAVARWSRSACFVLVGDGYPTGEVVRTLGIEVLGRLPDDRIGAAALCGHSRRRTEPARSPLGRTLARLAAAAASRAGTPAGVAESPAAASPPAAVGNPFAAPSSTARNVWERAAR